jgi:DNA-binding IclR family transcriptional regulator
MAQTGNQVLRRSVALLRAIAGGPSSGFSTTEAADATGLPRPTAHRLLAALEGEGMVDRNSETGRWSLGPELYLLGASASSRYDIANESRDVIEVLARRTGESAFLSARRGDETVCVSSREGSFPLRSHVLHEGIRFPLGVASAGLAILTHLPSRDIDDFFVRNELQSIWGEKHSEASVRERMASTRATGYSVNPGLIVEGSWGIGAAVFDRHDRPAWALSLTGVATRFQPRRIDEMGTLLLEQAHELSMRLR